MSLFINYQYDKAMTHTDDNNNQSIYQKIAKSNYIYLFISPKIALSNNLKRNMFDYICFAFFCFFAIVNIHLMK